MARESPIRVCHIVSGDTWGGLEVVVLNLMRAQAARPDVEPSLVVLNEGRFDKVAREAGFHVRTIPETEMNIWKLARAVDRTLSDLMPTIIHAHRYKEHFLSYILAWRYGAKCISTIHGYEPPMALSGRLKFKIWDSINFVLARLARARFVAVTEDLRQRYRVSSRRCTIIPNGIQLSDFDQRSERRMLADHLSIPVIGWIGRMVPVKGLAILLKAVAHMSSISRPLRVLLVGDGPERPELEALAERLGIRDSIEFVGFASEPRFFLAEMDVFVLPSLNEGVPMALLEALAAGIPVVAAAVGGIPGMIGDTGAALLVRSSSPEAWVAALTTVIGCPEQSNMMAKRGLQLVREQFSIDSMVNRYIAVYCAAVA